MHATFRPGTTTSYRSEGIGRLLRRQYLTDARQQFERGEITAAGFERIEDRAVDEALALGVVVETARAVSPRG
jgi:methionine synthase II (cobalamin-independent)